MMLLYKGTYIADGAEVHKLPDFVLHKALVEHGEEHHLGGRDQHDLTVTRHREKNGGMVMLPVEVQCTAREWRPEHSAALGCREACTPEGGALTWTRGPSGPGWRNPAPRRGNRERVD